MQIQLQFWDFSFVMFCFWFFCFFCWYRGMVETFLWYYEEIDISISWIKKLQTIIYLYAKNRVKFSSIMGDVVGEYSWIITGSIVDGCNWIIRSWSNTVSSLLIFSKSLLLNFFNNIIFSWYITTTYNQLKLFFVHVIFYFSFTVSW